MAPLKTTALPVLTGPPEVSLKITILVLGHVAAPPTLSSTHQARPVTLVVKDVVLVLLSQIPTNALDALTQPTGPLSLSQEGKEAARKFVILLARLGSAQSQTMPPSAYLVQYQQTTSISLSIMTTLEFVESAVILPALKGFAQNHIELIGVLCAQTQRISSPTVVEDVELEPASGFVLLHALVDSVPKLETPRLAQHARQVMRKFPLLQDPQKVPVRSFATQAVSQDDAQLQMIQIAALPARTLTTSSWSLPQGLEEEKVVVEESVIAPAPLESVRSHTWPTDVPHAPTQSTSSLTTLEERESGPVSSDASRPVR